MKNFAEKKFVDYLLSFKKDSSKTLQVVFYALYMQDSLTFGALSNSRSLSLAFDYEHNLKVLETKFKKIEKKFCIWKNVKQFSYMKECLS